MATSGMEAVYECSWHRNYISDDYNFKNSKRTYRIVPNFRGGNIFADWSSETFRGNKFRGPRILESHAHL